MIRDPKVLSKPWKIWSTNQYLWFYHSILSRKSSEWLETSVAGDLGMWFANIYGAFTKPFRILLSSNTLSSVRVGLLSRVSYVLIFMIQKNEIFYIGDPWSSIFSVRNPWQRSPCITLFKWKSLWNGGFFLDTRLQGKYMVSHTTYETVSHSKNWYHWKEE